MLLLGHVHCMWLCDFPCSLALTRHMLTTRMWLACTLVSCYLWASSTVYPQNVFGNALWHRRFYVTLHAVLSQTRVHTLHVCDYTCACVCVQVFVNVLVGRKTEGRGCVHAKGGKGGWPTPLSAQIFFDIVSKTTRMLWCAPPPPFLSWLKHCTCMHVLEKALALMGFMTLYFINFYDVVSEALQW